MSQRESEEKQEGSGSGQLPPTAIKIASRNANQRTSGGAPDPGPGDPNAAPSEAPQLVDIPAPPTPSQLIVRSKSKASGPAEASVLPTLVEGKSMGTSSRQSGSKSRTTSSAVDGSETGPAASNPSAGVEPTSSRPLSRPAGVVGSELSGGASDAAANSGATGASASGQPSNNASRSRQSQSPSGGPEGSPIASPGTGSEGAEIHDEEADGEVEHLPSPAGSSSPLAASAVFRSSPKSVSSHTSAASGSASPSTSGHKRASSRGSTSPHSRHKNNKKVTRFRYHKRITVRTTGKTNPSSIMHKVQKPGLSPSTIEELDPKELLKKAGIKDSKHWRIRLRQTKRVTKNGKTSTETKTAYRDSSGHTEPPCKKCGKYSDKCKC